VLDPAFRGQGAGHRFFDEREQHARSFGDYTHACFCAVVRPADHSARPKDYRPLDDFWRKRGYEPCPGVVARFHWRDRGDETETGKPLQFWMKAL
jgi:GNAT superfamily N-acetyltransferase